MRQSIFDFACDTGPLAPRLLPHRFEKEWVSSERLRTPYGTLILLDRGDPALVLWISAKRAHEDGAVRHENKRKSERPTYRSDVVHGRPPKTTGHRRPLVTQASMLGAAA